MRKKLLLCISLLSFNLLSANDQVIDIEENLPEQENIDLLLKADEILHSEQANLTVYKNIKLIDQSNNQELRFKGLSPTYMKRLFSPSTRHSQWLDAYKVHFNNLCTYLGHDGVLDINTTTNVNLTKLAFPRVGPITSPEVSEIKYTVLLEGQENITPKFEIQDHNNDDILLDIGCKL